MQNPAIQCILCRKMDHFDRPSTTLFWAIQTNLHKMPQVSAPPLQNNKTGLAKNYNQVINHCLSKTELCDRNFLKVFRYHVMLEVDE